MAECMYWDWRADTGRAAHGCFLLKSRGECWLGRKPEPEHGASAALHNVVRAEHLLGSHAMFHQERDGGKHVRATTRPLNEARRFLASINSDPDAELVFPWSPAHANGKAFACSPDFWSSMADHADVLAKGEQHMRPLCARSLRALPDGALVRDPACSTGDFIAAMADDCPTLQFEGSDINPDMVRTACLRHPDCRVSFACTDPATDAPPCDALILRFLNAEVMSQAEAIALFDKLARSVRPGGRVILFGHTPVLLPVHDRAAALGLRVMRSVASVAAGVVQYYVLQWDPALYRRKLHD